MIYRKILSSLFSPSLEISSISFDATLYSEDVIFGDDFVFRFE